ncbi:MAG: TonB family protein [Desulfofustis sp. PB-SRB1]|nr:TonB family protein [Desulfofustis sp. PB-SRB1]MBM1000921.1 TonB family protein [Desulfofustis sp. PB-SRB1]HBH28385.1 TonB family protein [Desulfofustis sp.]HBH31645.1 TonB family protein [Desulfofustis sp.]
MKYFNTYSGYDNWPLALNLAIAAHLLIGASVIFLPDMFRSAPKYEDIYTVSLIEMSSPVAAEPEPAVIEEQPPPVTPEQVEPEAVVIEPTPTPQIEIKQEPVKPVSIKPLKRKIIKPVVEPKPAIQDIEKQQREMLAEALRAEQLAREQARLAEIEAQRQQRLLEQQLALLKDKVRSTSRPASRTGPAGGGPTLIEKQYYAAIINHISQFWTLPNFKVWDEGTQAKVVVYITKDGTIRKHEIEQRSGDPTFDQFVSRTLADASPVPPIPPALAKNDIELGFIFLPGTIR